MSTGHPLFAIVRGMNIRLARQWASVPGVVFPEPVKKILTDKRCVTVRPPASEWISAVALAKHLGITTERANALGMRHDEGYKVYTDPINPMSRTRFFRRRFVMNAEVKHTEDVAKYEKTHVVMATVLKTLNLSRSAVSKLVAKGKLHPIRVSGGGRKGIYYVYSKKELQQIKKERQNGQR